jgi:hypothetical protein
MPIYAQFTTAQDAALGVSGTLIVNGLLIQQGSGNLTLNAPPLTQQGSGNLTLNGPPPTQQGSGNLTLNGPPPTQQGSGTLTLQGNSVGVPAGGSAVAQAPGGYSFPWRPNSPSSGGSGGVKQAPGGYAFPWHPTPAPHSLIKVSIINTGLLNFLPAPAGPSASAQPRPKHPHAAETAPPWLKLMLLRLRVYLRPTATVEMSGFKFDPNELSAFAGVPVRDVG